MDIFDTTALAAKILSTFPGDVDVVHHVIHIRSFPDSELEILAEEGHYMIRLQPGAYEITVPDRPHDTVPAYDHHGRDFIPEHITDIGAAIAAYARNINS